MFTITSLLPGLPNEENNKVKGKYFRLDFSFVDINFGHYFSEEWPKKFRRLISD